MEALNYTAEPPLNVCVLCLLLENLPFYLSKYKTILSPHFSVCLPPVFCTEPVLVIPGLLPTQDLFIDLIWIHRVQKSKYYLDECHCHSCEFKYMSQVTLNRQALRGEGFSFSPLDTMLAMDFHIWPSLC